MPTLDPEIAAAQAQLRAAGFPPIDVLTPTQVREGARRQPQPAPELFGSVASVEELTVPGAAGPLRARAYRPRETSGTPPVIAFLHGGGFVLGDLDSHDGVCRMLSQEARSTVVAVDYRLAPEHPFPAAAEDAVAAVAWIRDHAAELGGDPARVAVAGDSAGGNLAAVAAQALRGERLAAQLLVYPATGGGRDFPSHAANADALVLDAGTLRWFDGHYRGDPGDVRYAPLAAPSLAGQPPAVVGVAGFDPLHDEGVAYAEQLRAAGVEVVLRDDETLVHGYFGMGPVSRAADAAARRLCRDLGALLGTR